MSPRGRCAGRAGGRSSSCKDRLPRPVPGRVRKGEVDSRQFVIPAQVEDARSKAEGAGIQGRLAVEQAVGLMERLRLGLRFRGGDDLSPASVILAQAEDPRSEADRAGILGRLAVERSAWITGAQRLAPCTTPLRFGCLRLPQGRWRTLPRERSLSQPGSGSRGGRRAARGSQRAHGRQGADCQLTLG